MFKTIGLLPIVAAAAFVVAGCEQRSAEAPANNAAEAQANAAGTDTGSSSGGAPTGGVCGGIANIQCSAASDFCQLPTGQCDVADAQGVCTTRPEICTADYRPVCGCDGTTYSNACKAAEAGVNVRAEGECPGGAAAEANSTAQ